MAYHPNSGGGSLIGGGGGIYSGDDRESRSGDDRPESDLGDKPQYTVEHLATFTVNKESDITFPADGMRKLLQLEKTTGIWSQKMQLCLDRQWVLIIDYETGDVMERFSASQIQEPTAFTSQDPMEIYNNILVFIVSGGNITRSEMHIFQCQTISAVHLVEDFKKLRNGTLATPHRDLNAPSHQQQQQQLSSQRESFSYNNQETDSELGGLNDETSSTSSEKYERDVTVLNHCFDDIEKFIARLQHAAAASRELERRRRNRKSKKKDPGEGLLSMRTRPPTEKEFIDIFAKFKLSFNLLAKLKAHIHDPNAPELVHFLFTPLALIVDASHDTYYEHLPARVVKPLLTREAINLLVNCVTSKETELWRSLGDSWIISRDQWKGHVSSYHPVFFDGWSPEYPVIDELDNTPSTPTNIKKRIEVQNFAAVDYDYEPQQPGSPNLRDFSAPSDISIDSIEQRPRGPPPIIVPAAVASDTGSSSNEIWMNELQSRGVKIVQVTYPRTANNDKELTVVRGEYLEIMDDSRKWWKARNNRDQVGHVPHTIVTPFNYNLDGNEPIYPQNFSKHPKELSDPRSSDRFGAPSNDQQNNSGNADYIRNKHLGKKDGSFNSYDSSEEDYRHSRITTAAVVSVPPPREPPQPVVVRKTVVPLTNGNANEPPPPPPPLPPPAPATTASRPTSRTNTLKSQKSFNEDHASSHQEELKQAMTLFRERRKLGIVRTPEIFIQQSSSPEEVKAWLQAKGFSEKTVSMLNGLTGNEMFALTRTTLEGYCGVKEGSRLHSQITIQRNVSGYKTARGTELQAVLDKRRSTFEPLNI